MTFKSILLSIIVVSMVISSYAQASFDSADSLFDAKKYTEAYDLYLQIYEREEASPAMLLKMAFIKEGLSDYASALVYLNQYYKLSGDRRTYNKIEELANAHDLRGYEYSDQDFFLNILYTYKKWILSALIMLSLGLVVQLYLKRRKNEFSSLNIFLQILTIILTVFVANNFFKSEQAILKENRTLIVSAPSAGGEPIEVLEKGHKVTVLEELEVWAKIVWNEEIVYVRRAQLQKI